MGEALAHRGPATLTICGSGMVGLVSLGNTTGDASSVRAADEAFAVVAAARLDNRDELLAALDMPRDPSGPSEDELILAAYRRWGAECPGRMQGDFAFAIWDPERARLFLARDRFGVRPLVYHHRPGRLLAFATEVKAVLALREVPRRLDESRILTHLVPDRLTIPPYRDNTFYADVRRLRPAHGLTAARTRGLTERCYWAIDPWRELRFGRDADYADRFRELFVEAVRCRLRGAHPIASQLSGGLDSSAVTGAARRELANPGALVAISAVFDGVPQSDESGHIRAAAAWLGLEPVLVRGDLESPLADLERRMWHLDEPVFAANQFLSLAMYRAAAAAGARVLLGGLDGDTTVSHGYGLLTELARRGRWVRVVRETILTARRGRRRSGGRLLVERVLRALAPDGVRTAWRALRRRPAPGAAAHPLLAPEFMSRLEEVGALELAGPPPERSDREEHVRRLTAEIVPYVLETVERAAAAFAIEMRHPFCDARLVEFCVAIPADQKLRDGWDRWVMRRGLDGVLPPAVQWRPGKSNLGHNFRHRLLQDRPRLDALLLPEPSPLAPYVRLAAARAAYQRFITGPTDSDALTVWRCATLAAWVGAAGV